MRLCTAGEGRAQRDFSDQGERACRTPRFWEGLSDPGPLVYQREVRTPLPAVLALTAAWLGMGVGCIEPAPNAGSQRTAFDRGPAAPYLVASAHPAHPVQAVFGRLAELTGWELEPATVRRGDRARLTLFWKALDASDDGYRVFVHLDTPDGNQRVTADHDPAQGTLPTQVWRRGDQIRDPVSFQVPLSVKGSELNVWVGWYDGDVRVPIADAGGLRRDGEDRLLLGTIPVR